ncbi:DUF4391 domain-containing protein [Finegoldia magna]|uniref:DUF4391 domain-containing protein n=1 Tax=Finegoldia magna TaxID=1260 RepID=A0A6N2YA78_FINMA|nr:DUF4391 domain-containing protein [Finegoldia magna]MDU2500554.1 DUF4391 domain-containing protein [Finegoldia magna]
MFALSNTTEIKKTISKKSIYEKFKNKLTPNQKSKFDKEISKITLINEISERSIQIQKTDAVAGIFVIKVELKTKDYSESNIVLISKLIEQKLMIALKYEDQYQLCINETKLFKNQWSDEEDINLEITGTNLEEVWENLVAQVGNIDIQDGNTLQEQIEINNEKQKLEKLIQATEKKAQRELQSKKKLQYYQQIRNYQKELEKFDLHNK